MSDPRSPVSANNNVPTKVGVVSRSGFAREALLRVLGSEGEFHTIDLGSGPDSIDRARAADPDLVLIDLRPADACTLAEALLEAVAGTRPVAVHRDSEPDQLVLLAEAGFVGFVSSDCTYQDLLRELRGVLRQEASCSPQLAGALLRSMRRRSGSGATPTDYLAALSPRERQVALLLERRYSNKEIAAELGIEFGTVKNHVHSVLTKLGLRTRWEVPHLKANDKSDPHRPA